jgi:hypothetical protein
VEEPNYDSREPDSRELAMRADMEHLVADIRESQADIEAGRVASVAETFAEVHRSLAAGSNSR